MFFLLRVFVDFWYNISMFYAILAQINTDALDTLSIVIICLVVLLALGAIALSDSLHRQRLARARVAAFERFRKSCRPTYLRVPPPNDGQRYLFSQRADLIETRRYRVSNHIGGGRRISGLLVGLGQSRSRSYDEWRKIDSGALYLTDRELTFLGQRYSRTFPLRDILALTGDPLHAHVASKRREKAVIFACNGLILDLIFRRLEMVTK